MLSKPRILLITLSFLSLQVLHLGIKLSYLAEQQEKYEDAMTSYVWALSQIQRSIPNRPEDDDLAELWGLGNS